jgi:hypothetical protein
MAPQLKRLVVDRMIQPTMMTAIQPRVVAGLSSCTSGLLVSNEKTLLSFEPSGGGLPHSMSMLPYNASDFETSKSKMRVRIKHTFFARHGWRIRGASNC